MEGPSPDLPCSLSVSAETAPHLPSPCLLLTFAQIVVRRARRHAGYDLWRHPRPGITTQDFLVMPFRRVVEIHLHVRRSLDVVRPNLSRRCGPNPSRRARVIVDV